VRSEADGPGGRPRLPAEGNAILSVGGEDGYIMFGFPDTRRNTELADEIARRLAGPHAVGSPPGFRIETPEAGWWASKLSGTRWGYVIFVQQIGEHGEREWDLPGPFDVEATADGPLLELVFRRVSA